MLFLLDSSWGDLTQVSSLLSTLTHLFLTLKTAVDKDNLPLRSTASIYSEQ